MISELLPIGSVVILKNGIKPVMIYGVKQFEQGIDKSFDYCGVLYPEGNIGPNYVYLFNHYDIEEILYMGYVTDEYYYFLNLLKDHYSRDRADE